MANSPYAEIRKNLEREASVVAELLAIAGTEAPKELRTGMKALGGRANILATFIGRVEAGAIPVKVAVVGDFSSGKSSFINSLLQDSTLCPERPDPTTSLVTTFTYGPKERILEYQDRGRPTTITRARYKQRVQTGGTKSAQRRFTFHLPHPLLKGLQILDTPGFNNQMNPADSEVTTSIMEDADAFLYLVDANTGTIADTGIKQVRQIRCESSDAPVYLIISKADQKSDSALIGIKARFRRDHGDLFHDRILTYTTQEPRPSFDGQKDMEALFNGFQKEKVVLARATLKRLLSAHRDLRLQASTFREDLTERAAQLTQEIKHQKAVLAKFTTRAREAFQEEAKALSDELIKPLGDALLAEKATEDEDEGWFFTDGKIRFNPFVFRRNVGKLMAFDGMEEVLARWHRSLFGRRAPHLPQARALCRSARTKAADAAVAITLAKWAEEIKKNYDDVDEAQETIDELLKPRCISLAMTIKAQWQTLFEAQFHDVGPAYIEETCADLNRRRKELRKGLLAWKNLIKNMPKAPR